MSRYAEINASKAKTFDGRTGSVHGEWSANPWVAGNGRQMGRVEHSYPLQRSRHEPVRTGAPTTTTMTASAVQDNSGAGATGRKVVQYFLPKVEPDLLSKSENAWVPSRMRTKNTELPQQSTGEDAQIQESRKKFMSILNKVTPENQHLLKDQIMALPTETEQCLRKAIELLFQKAIDEPLFTPQYARICTELHKKDSKQNSGTNSKMSFKKLLTICCQERLNQMHAHDKELEKILQNIDGCNDKVVKEQMQSEYNQNEWLYRDRSVGNCRFMCELYKVELLTRNTIEMSLKHLLKTPKEETLECACNILNYIGNTISHKASFKKLTEYTSPECTSEIPTRIKFMMEKTIDLKENDWVPRNLRPKSPISNMTAIPYTKKPVLQAPIAQTVTTQKKKEVPMEVRKVNVGQSYRVSTATKIEDPKLPSLPVEHGIKSYASLVSPCATRVTESTKSCQPSDDEVQIKFQSIIDDICPENVVLMTQSLLALPITTEACLKAVVDMVFKKALSEPELNAQYAYVCSSMKNVRVCSEEQKDTYTTFRILLIAMCQNEFESMSTHKGLVAKERMDIESCKDKETRRQLQSQFDQNELDYKRRSVANCRFISELLKVKVLVPPIIEMCEEKLVETIKEIPLECLHVMVKHTGNEINHRGIFEKLYEYTDKQKLSSRLRSIIQETLELQKTIWPPSEIPSWTPLMDKVV